MVVVNQELAAVVAAKKAEEVDDEHVVQLAAEHVFESAGGIRLTRSEYTNGGRCEGLSNFLGRTGTGRAGAGRVDGANWLDELTARIGDLMDQYWACQKERVRAESVGTEDGRLQRLATTDKSVNGAKLLLQTAANRVRQVVEEIEIVTGTDNQ